MDADCAAYWSLVRWVCWYRAAGAVPALLYVGAMLISATCAVCCPILVALLGWRTLGWYALLLPGRGDSLLLARAVMRRCSQQNMRKMTKGAQMLR